VVIAVTASTFEEDRLRALDAGCDDFLSKPYQESALLELIQKHLHLEYVYEAQNNTHQS
jgi:CheY-like chemotaxis protein